MAEIDSFAPKNQLSPSDHAALENHLAAARAHAAAIDGHAAAEPGSTTEAPANPLDRSATRYLQGLFDAMGLTGAAYAPARGAVQAALMRDVQSFTAQHGRTPNDRERRDMIDRQLIEVEYDVNWITSGENETELKGEQNTDKLTDAGRNFVARRYKKYDYNPLGLPDYPHAARRFWLAYAANNHAETAREKAKSLFTKQQR